MKSFGTRHRLTDKRKSGTKTDLERSFTENIGASHLTSEWKREEHLQKMNELFSMSDIVWTGWVKYFRERYEWVQAVERRHLSEGDERRLRTLLHVARSVRLGNIVAKPEPKGFDPLTEMNERRERYRSSRFPDWMKDPSLLPKRPPGM